MKLCSRSIGCDFAEQHTQPGDDEKRAKNKKNKMEARDERHAQPDHGGPHHKRAQDSPDQDPMLVARRDPEVGENQTEDKNVIYTERVFDQVTGKKSTAWSGPSNHQTKPLKAKERPTQRKLRRMALGRLMRSCARSLKRSTKSAMKTPR
jgi:hypothetical protein